MPILAPCTIFIGLNFHTIHKVFLQNYQTVALLHLYSYNTHINKGNLKGFCGEELMSVEIFGIVANFFVQKRKNQDYQPDDPREIKYVDEVLKLLSVMTGDKKYESILYSKQKSVEVKSMCEVAERLVRKGREEGIQSAVNILRKVGKTEEEILELIMEEYKLEREKVLQYL